MILRVVVDVGCGRANSSRTHGKMVGVWPGSAVWAHMWGAGTKVPQYPNVRRYTCRFIETRE